MPLSEERKGQIALGLVKAKFKRDGLRLSPNAKRELGVLAQEAGATIEEMQDFIPELLPELIGSAFGLQKVSVTCAKKT
jgi:hypothetical protein